MELLIVTEPVNGYERGDIVAVRQDGAVWGRAESIEQWVAEGNDPDDFPHPEFSIVQMPGEPADLNLTEPEIVDDPVDGGRQVKKRGWRLDIDKLPKKEREGIDKPGAVVSVERARRNSVRRKRDDRQLPLRADNGGGEPHRHDGTKVQRGGD